MSCFHSLEALPVNLAEHQVHGTNDGDTVGNEVSSHHEVCASQVGESRSADLASIWLVGSVGDEEDTHLTLGRLNGGVGLARRYAVALGEEQEVMDERLHRLLHARAWRGHELVVVDFDLAGGHLVEALLDDAEGLPELLDAAEVAVVAVSVLADGHVELDLVVCIVGCDFADVPGDAGATEHHAGEAVVKSLLGGDLADANGTALPDTVTGDDLLDLINARAELGGPLVDVIEQTVGQVVCNTTGTDVGGVQAGA